MVTLPLAPLAAPTSKWPAATGHFVQAAISINNSSGT
ncbi:MAG: hypothetical protein ACI8ZT_002186, partial [Bacteroidia bacterium]